MCEGRGKGRGRWDVAGGDSPLSTGQLFNATKGFPSHALHCSHKSWNLISIYLRLGLALKPLFVWHRLACDATAALYSCE